MSSRQDLPPYRLFGWVGARPAALVYAVCMSLTAVVNLAGVGGASLDAYTFPVTRDDVAYVPEEASTNPNPVMKLAAAGLKSDISNN